MSKRWIAAIAAGALFAGIGGGIAWADTQVDGSDYDFGDFSIYTVEDRTENDASTIQEAWASCDSGDYVIGGGIERNTVDGDMIISESHPHYNPISSWEATVRNDTGGAITWTVYAVCAHDDS